MKKISTYILGLIIIFSIIKQLETHAEFISSPELIITEILPNPKGADKGQEWIEFYNNSKQNIDLSNWKLNNGKNYILPSTTLPPKSYFILENETLKMTLKNSNATLKLIDSEGVSSQEISFSKSKEGLSYSLISIKTANQTKTTWNWTTPTKSQPNQTLYLITGKISTPPQISEDFYFTIKDNQNRESKIIFTEDLFSFDLLSTILKENSAISVVVEKNNNKFILKSFKLNQPTQQKSPTSSTPTTKNTHPEYLLLIPAVLLTGLLIFANKRFSRPRIDL